MYTRALSRTRRLMLGARTVGRSVLRPMPPTPLSSITLHSVAPNSYTGLAAAGAANASVAARASVPSTTRVVMVPPAVGSPSTVSAIRSSTVEIRPFFLPRDRRGIAGRGNCASVDHHRHGRRRRPHEDACAHVVQLERRQLHQHHPPALVAEAIQDVVAAELARDDLGVAVVIGAQLELLRAHRDVHRAAGRRA